MKNLKVLSAFITSCLLIACVSAAPVSATEVTEHDEYVLIECGTNEDPLQNDASVVNMNALKTIACGTTDAPPTNSTLSLPAQEPRWEDSVVQSRVAAIHIDVQSPIEDSWKQTYSSYYYEANRVIETIDDYLSDEFGIDFYSVRQPNWSTEETIGENVIYDAIAHVGKGDADIMIAFIGPVADGYTPEGYQYLFGIATVGQPYAVVFDHNYRQNCKTGQHEVGHTYGLCPVAHCTRTCVMRSGWDNGTEWNYFNHLCTEHWNQWNTAKNKYGS